MSRMHDRVSSKLETFRTFKLCSSASGRVRDSVPQKSPGHGAPVFFAINLNMTVCTLCTALDALISQTKNLRRDFQKKLSPAIRCRAPKVLYRYRGAAMFSFLQPHRLCVELQEAV